MRLAKYRGHEGHFGVGIVEGDGVMPIDLASVGVASLAELLASADVLTKLQTMRAASSGPLGVPGRVVLVAPIDQQEVWAAGVTYLRSKAAREQESEGAAKFYDLVYSAARPELFFKATARRVVGPERPVRARADSRWSVPEPEIALVIAPDGRIVGYTLGNDMSARDIEGENPLYLPQAKIYSGSCALGPCITLASAMPQRDKVAIHLRIRRGVAVVFEAETSYGRLARTPEELVEWLFKENEFPDGVILLTGTGIVPPDDFTLVTGDEIEMDATGIGTLKNIVSVG